MKNLKLFILCLFCTITLMSRSQNAPLTMAEAIVTALPGNDVIIPVKVYDFNEIGNITLTLDYDPGVLVFISSSSHPMVNDLIITLSFPGRLIFTRGSNNAVSLSDGSALANLVFQYSSGKSTLSWFDDGGSCQYKDEFQQALTDTPMEDYYIDGVVSSKSSPVTYAPLISNAMTGLVNVPVTTENFKDILSFELTLEYDPWVLTYMTNIPNASLAGGLTVSDTPGSSGKNNLIITWSGPATSLSDGSNIVALSFQYTEENGFSYSTLKWIDDGSSCNFTGVGPENLWDSPASDYYHDGLVADQVSPLTYLPVITNAVSGISWIPVIIENFNNISGVSLTFEFDPDVLTYADEFTTPVPGLFASSQALPNGNQKIIIAYFGDAVSLPDGDTLVNIKFNYLGATSTFIFLDDGESCEYADQTYSPLMDYPREDFYQDGLITDQLAPQSYFPSLTIATPGNVSIPVNTNDFEAISAFTLAFNYDPAVLSFIDALPNAALSGTFSFSALVPGEVLIEWTGLTDVTMPDGSQLCLLNFSYNGGSSNLSWNDSEGACEFVNMNADVLYDTPTTSYYGNGIISGQYAPVTYLPSYTIAIEGSNWLPVTVDNLDEITAFSLAFTYDPSVITYENEYSSEIGGLAAGSQLLPDGTGRIDIHRMGPAVSLADGDTLVLLKFNFVSDTTSLSWIVDGTTCMYRDVTNFPLHDSPKETYYIDGLVLSDVAPIIVADSVTAGEADWVTQSIRAYNFTGINSFSFTLDYDPGVIIFDCATPNIALTGSFYASESTPGRLEIGWFDVEKTLPDGSVLIYIRYQYLGGSTGTDWFNDGASCEFTSGELYLPLHDQPTSYFYRNGQVADYLVWTGALSSAWEDPGNWQGNHLPDSLCDVKISSTPVPPHYPVFTGDYSIGRSCKNLLISGTAQMDINGSFTINPQSLFKFTDNGKLGISGDWINFGGFEAGNGCVAFTGSSDSHISQQVFPENISSYTLSTLPVGMTELTGTSNILNGDNTHIDINIGFLFNFLGEDYNQLRINSNGWVSLNKSGSDATSMDNINLFTSDQPTTVLAPWWDNLKADGASRISYQATDNKITIE